MRLVASDRTAMTVRELDRIARLDGYRVREATTRSQRAAWQGRFAVFRGRSFLFNADSPDQVRAWLHDQARMAA